MMRFIKTSLMLLIFAALFGCASDYETRLPPPEALNPVFMRYKELPGQKVFVIAVDPTGQWAFGYDHSRETLEQAAESAAVKCDKARLKHRVFAKAKIFAVNDEVVYYNTLDEQK